MTTFALLSRLSAMVGAALALASPVLAANAGVAALRLYTLDCGTLSLESLALFEDTDAYHDTPGTMAVPCFLVRHPQGDLIWDTGLGDGLAQQGEVAVAEGITARVEVTLEAQLRQLDLAPSDIEFLALSHLHFDHTSNAPLFAQSTYLVSRAGLDWARGTPTPFGVNPDSLAVLDSAKTQLLDLDHDVFGDGSVRILRAPGHTPGHQVLMLQLPGTGTVILSGDLYHSRDNYRFSRVPAFNHSRADTLASFDRIAGLMKEHAARLVIQHAPEDFAALPRFPAYLE